MAKKRFPTKDQIINSKQLKFLRKFLIADDLWHFNRKSVAKATFVGLFMAFVPLPMQTIFAVLGALVVRANMITAIGVVWVTNPFTVVPMFYAAYKLGEFILARSDVMAMQSFHMSWHYFAGIWAPLLLGSAICAVVSGSIGYIVVLIFWKKK